MQATLLELALARESASRVAAELAEERLSAKSRGRVRRAGSLAEAEAMAGEVVGVAGDGVPAAVQRCEALTGACRAGVQSRGDGGGGMWRVEE